MKSRPSSSIVPALLAVAAALAGLLGGASGTFAQLPPNCTELCGVSCVKPIAMPDRWDDVTPIVGYTGGKSGNWANNGVWDQEAFTDTNGNGLWDPGEPFFDGNGNSQHDSEAFDPLTTGYVAGPTAGNSLAPNGDLGLEITLHLASPGSPPTPGQYLAIDFPPINKGTPVTGSGPYQDNWANCNPSAIEPRDLLQLEPGGQGGATNQAMRDLIAQDPNAYWDPSTQSIQGSAFTLSPRVIFVAAYDPRITNAGRNSVQVTKIVPMFMEQVTGTAQVLARFVNVSTSGTACTGGSAGGFLYACATPATRASWGQVKATYR